ncbi:hypothetical protein CHS0354_001462 [Potamilus streckersoni]|uniref:Uncharacterized protein n=1 Tax=Potamilus streckersoni TaxID=2493646 RepID=A0AAE0W8K7_9BIVA|nr:hypothetical protein CHS0354_001462 [Potamilus streckersoni]
MASIGSDKEKADLAQRLFAAIMQDDDEKVLALLNMKADPNFALNNLVSGRATAIHSAVRRNHLGIVKHLLEFGADVNMPDEDGDTPLFSSLTQSSSQSIRDLLYKYGADRNIRNIAGKSPLMKMFEDRQLYNYKFQYTTLFDLLNHCDDLHQTDAHGQSFVHLVSLIHPDEKRGCIEADRHHCRDYLQWLSARGVPVCLMDSDGQTPLHKAAASCCFQAVQFLIDSGCDATTRDLQGKTALHCLGVNPHRFCFKKILKLLLREGCEINETDCMGRTLLHYVTTSNKTCKSAVNAVILMKANPILQDKCGLNSLHFCVLPSVFTKYNEDEEEDTKKTSVSDVVETLVKHGVDINSCDYDGITPLHYAVRQKKLKVIETLILLGSDPSIRTKTGETAIHRSTINAEILEVVLQTMNGLGKTVDLNAKDIFGSTPLHWAVNFVMTGSVRILLKNNCEECIDGCGRTPADLACFLRLTCLYEDLGIIYQRGVYPMQDAVCASVKRKHIIKFAFDGIGKESLRSLMYDLMKSAMDIAIELDSQATESTDIRGEADEEHSMIHSNSSEAGFETEDTEWSSNSSGDDSNFAKDDEATIHTVFNDNQSNLGRKVERSSHSDSGQDLFHNADLQHDMYKESKCEDHFDLDQRIEGSIYFASSESSLCPGKDDMFVDCPLLQTIYNEDKEILLLPWQMHLIYHQESLSKYVHVILNSGDMGLEKETQENIDIASQISDLIKTTAEEVGKRNPLLKCEVRPAGSRNEGTKVGYQNEFDFSWILINFNDAFIPKESSLFPPEYVRLHLRDDAENGSFKQFVDYDKILDGRKVIRALYSAINNVLLEQKKVGSTKYVYLRKFLNINKGSIDKLSVRWVGGYLYKDVLIDIDIVPVITPPNWIPTQIKLDSRLLEDLEQKPSFSIVLKTPDARFVRDWHTFLRIDVAHLEALVIKNVPEPIRKGYILVKALVDTPYMPQIYDKDKTDYYIKRFLTTYMLKTCFLHELEEAKMVKDLRISNDEDPKRVAVDWATRIVGNLEKSLYLCILPSFFAPDVNLLVNNSVMIVNDSYMIESECICLKHLLKVGAFDIINK